MAALPTTASVADRGVDVEVRDPDALGSEPVDVLGLDLRAAEAGQVRSAHVVDEHRDDVRTVRAGEAFRILSVQWRA
jgi:hypothetical protein